MRSTRQSICIPFVQIGRRNIKWCPQRVHRELPLLNLRLDFCESRSMSIVFLDWRDKASWILSILRHVSPCAFLKLIISHPFASFRHLAATVPDRLTAFALQSLAIACNRWSTANRPPETNWNWNSETFTVLGEMRIKKIGLVQA